MTTQPPLPNAGQEPWDATLNAYLTALDARVMAVENKPDLVFNVYSYQFSNLAPPATGSQVRLNNTDPALATLIDIRKIDNEGADRTAMFQQIRSGSKIRIQDWDNAGIYHRWHVTGNPTIGADNAQFPVAHEAGSGIIPNAKAAVAVVTTFMF